MKGFAGRLVTLFIVLFTVFFVVTPLIAQEGEDGAEEEQTIEELYLQSAEMSVIREQAITVDREMKLLALENMEELIEAGKVDENSADALYLLDYLAVEGVAREVRVNGRLINYFPEVRRKSCNLLGKIGGETAKNTLLYVLDKDVEPMVLSEATYALGKIGLNNGEEVANAIAYKVREQTVVAPDNNFAFSALLAFEKLAEANGGLNNPEVYNTLIQIAQGNYIRDVRQKAFEVMEELRSY